MTFDEYQVEANKTAEYPHYNIHDILGYLGLGISGEAGEVANKLKKVLRGDYTITDEVAINIAYELGDCLWYISELAKELNFSLSSIAQMNLNKLAERKKNNVIKGTGDNR